MAPITRLRPSHPPATPTGHTHQPHPPTTPTSHTHLHTYLLHHPATSISPMTHVCGGWVCQVCVSGGRVRLVCHTYLPHPHATPTCHAYLLYPQAIPINPMTNLCGGYIRLLCQLGLQISQIRSAY